MRTTTHRQRAREYLRVAGLYRLGRLPTERPHPRTRDLSRWARDDLPTGIETLKQVDLRALRLLESYGERIDRLRDRVAATLRRGHRVFLCGCGATGRLSLGLEFLWRRSRADDDRVVSLMAGGDVALVHALEGFEDHPEYGARHLEQLGFGEGDLLVATTEGGETPYVLGAAERAAALSSNPPSLLYCNADAVLVREVARFRRIYENPRVEKICLYVGPMALAGSTRMQASTVLQLAVGLALLHPERSAASLVRAYRRRVESCDLAFLAGFVAAESAIYERGDRVTYRVRDYGITVFTDTTERAPTFSLVPFDQLERQRDPHSLCYVVLDDAGTASEAWARLLHRDPRALGWNDVDPRTSSGYLYDFDFSSGAAGRRRSCVPGREHHEFRVAGDAGRAIELELGGRRHALGVDGLPELFRHLLLKQALNIHSTLVMGRLGRYEGNLMTWVTPTNGKLVDRAARHVAHLLDRAGRRGVKYEDVVHRLFAEMARSAPDESVVLRTYRSLLGGNGSGRPGPSSRPTET